MTPAQVVEFARSRNLDVPQAPEGAYSTDANLWGRSIECGVLEDPWMEPPDDIYTLTRAPRDCPDEPAYVEIEFASGVPVNGVARREDGRSDPGKPGSSTARGPEPPESV